MRNLLLSLHIWLVSYQILYEEMCVVRQAPKYRYLHHRGVRLEGHARGQRQVHRPACSAIDGS